MADPGLQQSLTAAENAIAALKAQLQASQQQAESAEGVQVQAGFHEAIAELEAACDKVKQGMAPAPPQAPPMTAPGSADAVVKVEPVANAGPEEAPCRTEAGEKRIEVPVRQRTGQPRPAAAPVPRSFTLELPATPFNPRPGTDDQAPPTGQPAPTPGIPADTPMAAEVLASLGALGLQLGGLAAPGAAGARPPAARAPKRVSVTSAAAELPLGRRAAAVRAAEAAAALAPRPRPSKRDAALPPPGTVLLPEARPPASRFKTCNCKRSQCLKLYCECFAGGGYCLPGCQCFNCLNTVTEAATVDAARAAILAKNPRAFNEKVVGDTHKKGCRCKRSKCLKKYCECFNAGIKCNPEICQCEGCHNMQPSDPGNDENGEEAVLWGVAADEEQEAAVAPPSGKAPAPAAVEVNENAVLNAALQGPLASISAALAGVAAGAAWGEPEAAAAAAIVAATIAQPAAPAAAWQQPGAAAAAAVPVLLAQPVAAQQAQQQQQLKVEEAVAKPGPVAAAAPAPVAFVTPGGAGAAGPSALTSSHLSDVAPDGDVHDTATSPAPAGAAIMVKKERRVATMTAAAKAAAAAAAKGHDSPVDGGEGSGQRGKRPRRAASGGVQGAVAAAASDWGLVSPPPKRASSVPSAPEPGRGTAAAARSALLRKALHNEAAAAAGGGAGAAPPGVQPRAGDEADAVSVLVSLNGGP